MQTNILNILKSKKKEKNPINDLENLDKLYYFVWTYPKCGTTSLSMALQYSINKEYDYTNVVHCHSEKCFNKIFDIDQNIPLDILDLVKYQKRKPIIFQLFRNPIDRLLSNYNHLNNKNPNFKSFKDWIVENGVGVDQKYYENKLGYRLKNLQYDKKNKLLLIEKEKYYIYFTTLEHIYKLKSNLCRLFPQYFNRKFKIDKHNVSERKLIINLPFNTKINILNTNKDLVDFYYTDREIIGFLNLDTSKYKLVNTPKEYKIIERKFNCLINGHFFKNNAEKNV